MCFEGRFHSRCLTTVMLKSSAVLPGVSNQVGPGDQATLVSGRSGNDNWLFHQHPRNTYRIITLVLGDQPKKPISSQRSLHQRKDHRLISHRPDTTIFPHCGRNNQWDRLYGRQPSVLPVCVVIQSSLKDLKSRQRLRGRATPACRHS